MKEWFEKNSLGMIILAVLGFYGLTGFEMRGTLSKVETRVNEVAGAMPAVSKYFAWREVEAPVNGVLVSTLPLKLNEGKWVSLVHLIDPIGKSRYTYTVPLASREDPSLTYWLIGSTKSHERFAPSFTDLERFSMQIGQPVHLASQINSDASFIFRSDVLEQYGSDLSAFAGKPKKTRYDAMAYDWAEIASKTAEQQDLYRVPKEVRVELPNKAN